jgi:large conductance mechanosensitive channel
MGERKGLVKGFSTFIQEYGVAPLAIGVVVGTAVNDLVKSLVDGLVTPLISLLDPQQGAQNLTFTVHGAAFKIGEVVSSLLSFLTVMLIVYLVVKFILRQEDLLKKQ